MKHPIRQNFEGMLWFVYCGKTLRGLRQSIGGIEAVGEGVWCKRCLYAFQNEKGVEWAKKSGLPTVVRLYDDSFVSNGMNYRGNFTYVFEEQSDDPLLHQAQTMPESSETPLLGSVGGCPTISVEPD